MARLPVLLPADSGVKRRVMGRRPGLWRFMTSPALPSRFGGCADDMHGVLRLFTCDSE